MGDHQKCPVKLPILRKQSFTIKNVIPYIGVIEGVVHNNNFYITEDIGMKHTSTKFDIGICKNEVKRKRYKLAKIRKRRNQKKIPTPKTEMYLYHENIS